MASPLKLAQEHLLHTCTLPKLYILNMEPQFLELHVVLAIEDPLPRLSLKPGQQHTKLQRLLLQQQQSHLLNGLSMNQLNLLLHQKKLLQSKLPVLHWQLANP